MGAMYYNNRATKDMFDKITDFNNNTDEQSRYTKQDIQQAFMFLKQNSDGKQFQATSSPDLKNNRYQNYFTSTKSQYENNSLQLPISIGGMQDESYMFLPTTSILKTTTKAGNTLTKATLKEADKLYLQTGIKSDSFLRNKVAPRVEDVYYGTANKFLSNPTKYTQGGIDFIESYLPYSTPALNWWGLSGAVAGKIYSYEKLYNDTEQFIKDK